MRNNIEQSGIIANQIDSEINSLKDTIKRLVIEKYEYEKLLHEYMKEHSRRLRYEIDKILENRRDIIYKLICKSLLEEKINRASDRQSSSNIKMKFYGDIKLKDEDIFLSKEEKEILKNAYRQACKLCHPDLVESPLKEQAEEIFKELNSSFRNNDLKKLQQILNSLLSGDLLNSSNKISQNNESTEQKINKLKESISRLRCDISDILKENPFLRQEGTRLSVEEYYSFIGIHDLKSYFKTLKKILNDKLVVESEEQIKSYLKFEKNKYYLYCGIESCSGLLNLAGRCTVCNRTFEQTYEHEIVIGAIKKYCEKKGNENELESSILKILFYVGIPAVFIILYAFGVLN